MADYARLLEWAQKVKRVMNSEAAKGIYTLVHVHGFDYKGESYDFELVDELTNRQAHTGPHGEE